MTKSVKWLIGVAVFLVFLISSLLTYQYLKDSYQPPAPAALEQEAKLQAPDFTVTDVQGREVSLSSFAGKPVVVNFWASWCPPCKQEMPHFQAAYEQYGSSVAFLMVDMVDGQREKREDGTRYIADQGYTFPVYFDDDNQTVAYQYGVTALPSTLFIDRDGYVLSAQEGQISAQALNSAIEQLLQ